jgi:hypothetical protein
MEFIDSGVELQHDKHMWQYGLSLLILLQWSYDKDKYPQCIKLKHSLKFSDDKPVLSSIPPEHV